MHDLFYFFIIMHTHSEGARLRHCFFWKEKERESREFLRRLTQALLPAQSFMFGGAATPSPACCSQHQQTPPCVPPARRRLKLLKIGRSTYPRRTRPPSTPTPSICHCYVANGTARHGYDVNVSDVLTRLAWPRGRPHVCFSATPLP